MKQNFTAPLSSTALWRLWGLRRGLLRLLVTCRKMWLNQCFVVISLS